MCGVVGVFGPSAAQISKKMLQAIKVIQHRGPDGQGVAQSLRGDLIFGHVRLSILDLSGAAAQPMRDQDSILTFNGEIYNHRKLRQGLIAKPFSSTSDTETLLRGLVQQGPKFLNHLQGMFAGGFYDVKSDSVLLFRDSMGLKPLHYLTLKDSTVLFSSEIKALLQLSEQHTTCNLATLQSYLRFENYAADSSLFDGIQMLLPGQLLHFSKNNDGVWNKTESRISYQPVVENQNSKSQRIADRIADRIETSVAEHLLSDVDVGVYLSGGIDSSLVAAFAAKHSRKLAAYTGYFDTADPYFDERCLARQVAQKLNLKLNEVLITPQNFEDQFDSLIWHLDEPRMGMGSFSQFMVAKEFSKSFKVALSGHGGDELFGGYAIHKAAQVIDKGLFSMKAWGQAIQFSPKEFPWLAYLVQQKTFRKSISFAPEIFKVDQHTQIPAFHFDRKAALLSSAEDYYRTTYIPGLLVVEDKVSMAHGLETRTPLWSQEIFRWASEIPWSSKLEKGTPKFLLRQVAKELLPGSLLTAAKRGFPTPLRHWFRGPLAPFVQSRLLNSQSYFSLYAGELFGKNYIENLIQDHQKRSLPFVWDEKRAHRIWIFLCLESWFRQYRVTI